MHYYIITYNGSTPGQSGEQCGTEYDFTNACEICGTGVELKGNLKVKGISKTKRDYFETINGDCIISKRLKEVICQEISNFEVVQVVDIINQPQEFYHLYTRLSLPKSKETSAGFVRENPCSVCNRNGYFNDATIGSPTIIKPLELRYNYQDFKNSPDSVVLKTWECVGQSNRKNYGNNVIRYARPWIIVREDLKNIFDKERIKNLHFEQIKIEGSVQQNL
ncbi:hypothetical protein HUW51_17465 [Adhaeribacter swui]|uniref:Uncharacterized protein n=1 Tax=Adhaeribacter swui TaxID=2086471 RepID=A0A7G7GB90_9BACT|nr:hypothetical protein [Adhaeribacter swui]QNF34424.1 hypothetical protein HUW51_17465 [Adhaeribacter swui]